MLSGHRLPQLRAEGDRRPRVVMPRGHVTAVGAWLRVSTPPWHLRCNAATGFVRTYRYYRRNGWLST